MSLTPFPFVSAVRLLPLAELASILPQVLARVSPSRAAIIGEQIRAAIQAPCQSLVALICETVEISNAAVALLQHEPGADFATVLHVGSIRSDDSGQNRSWPHLLKESLEVVCKGRGIEFLQWATDPVEQENLSRHLAFDLGFRWLGTLEYLAKDLVGSTEGPIAGPCFDFRWRAIDPENVSEVACFQAIVHKTYQDTLDCPQLESMRSVSQILAGYRVAASYWPQGWYVVEDAGSKDGQGNIVGCVILARHDERTVTELTYMGVLPEQRGRRYGEAIFCKTVADCLRRGDRRLILAVDRANHFASELYRRHGMRPILRETVWGRCCETEDSRYLNGGLA